MWRNEARGRPLPLPFWVQQYFRRWSDAYDGGLFDSKEAAFASNAHYRYWNMVGVKDHRQESLIGQAGEVEPVYDSYALSFFLFEPSTRAVHFPQFTRANSSLEQSLENGYLPVVVTRYVSALGLEVEQRVLATTLGLRQRSIVLVRFRVRNTTGSAVAGNAWLCLGVSPAGPTGFERHDKAGRVSDRRVTFLRYVAADQRVEAGPTWGPFFDAAPAAWGLYGNPTGSHDPEHYLAHNAFRDLATSGTLNGEFSASDTVGGLCTGVFAFPITLGPAQPEFTLDVKLPVDDYRSATDVAELRGSDPAVLETNNRNYWTAKLDASGLTLALPSNVAHLWDLFRVCRANLLMLADDGEIHPGPTIYDSFWIRDSSVEAIACALVGDVELAERQLGTHHRSAFNQSFERIGPVSAYGFFGHEHEKNDREWDSNGQALWSFGRFDRIRGPGEAFGASIFAPYVIDGARWIRDNRSEYGLLHSGWSAEHIGDKDKPHYWDDLWALAGLYEAARLAERLRAPQTQELWDIFDDVKRATTASIRWVLDEQRRRGQWETFVPTGPGDVGRLDSTIVGALAYFHPCRLYQGPKLDRDIDWAMRQTLETIYAHFVDGGFRHDSAWNCYGPYLTLQLAHCFLYVGDVARMDALLAWSVGNAGYSRLTRAAGSSELWNVVLGAWNEQHAYPVAKDFAEFPGRSWYMGDIPHGWACAEFLMLLRDILLFEADEDADAHLWIIPGVPAHWMGDGQAVVVNQAPTTFGSAISFSVTHRAAQKRVEIAFATPPPGHVRSIYPCHFGNVTAASANGQPCAFSGREVYLPPGTTQAIVSYA
jgi:hypothetical protein